MSAKKSFITFALGVAAIALIPRSAVSAPVHSTTASQVAALEDSFAEVDEATARSLAKGCSIPKEMKGGGTAGSQTILQFTVSDAGKLLGVRRIQGILNHQLSAEFASCHFKTYKVNDVPTPFRANIMINMK